MENLVLDSFLPTQNAPADYYACDLWPSFSQNLQIEDCSVSRKRKEVDLEKNSDPEGVFYRFHRRVCPEAMFKNNVS